jgi:isopenicillin-N epimerase
MSLERRSFLARAGLATAAAALAPRAARALIDATGAVDWAAVRREFDLAPEWTHLATFFLVSHPRAVREAIEENRRRIDADPLSVVEESMFEPGHENLPLRVKAAIARYVGAAPQEIALTSNTTTGLALVYNGLRVRPGQEFLLTEHDHYSHQESARLAAEKNGAAMRRVALHDGAAGASADEIVGRLRRAITPRTRALGVTWVHSSTGLRLPIASIAAAVKDANAGRDEANRCLLVVDGVHGLGAVDEDVSALGADFFVAGMHKWMFGPRGTGIIRGKLDAWPHVRPTIPTFESATPFEDWERGRPASPRTEASWVSPGGFYAYEHFWALEAAVRFHESLGRSRIAARVRELNGRLRAALGAMPHVRMHTPKADALAAGIVCFEVDGLKPQQVVDRLRARKILASTSPYAVTYARISAGIMVQPGEVERTIGEIGALAA